MRTTAICLKQHIGRMFKAHWMIQGRKKIVDIGTEEKLKAHGITVYDPKEILTPVYPREPVEPHVIALLTKKEEPKRPYRHVVNEETRMYLGTEQAQHLTNSIVFNSLPASITSQVEVNSEEEDQLVMEAIRHSNLLDAYQEKLPRVFDPERTHFVLPRKYGIPTRRKNKSLTYQLLMLLDKAVPQTRGRHLIENATSAVTVSHSDRLLHFNFTAGFLVSSRKSLEPVMELEEVRSLKEILPDIYPFNSFLEIEGEEQYDPSLVGFAIPDPSLAPHTIYVHENEPIKGTEESDDHFHAVTLVNAFCHAAAYARQKYPDASDDLTEPVTVQTIQSDSRLFHFSIFQLNSFNLTGPTHNVLWHHSRIPLFDTCDYQGAAPTLTGYNPEVFSLFKAFHKSIAQQTPAEVVETDIPIGTPSQERVSTAKTNLHEESSPRS